MRHFTTSRFWDCYERLPHSVQQAADRAFSLLKQDSRHPSLRFKSVGDLYSVRIGIHYRVLATSDASGGIIWFWIGSHADYDQLLKMR